MQNVAATSTLPLSTPASWPGARGRGYSALLPLWGSPPRTALFSAGRATHQSFSGLALLTFWADSFGCRGASGGVQPRPASGYLWHSLLHHGHRKSPGVARCPLHVPSSAGLRNTGLHSALGALGGLLPQVCWAFIHSANSLMPLPPCSMSGRG